MPFRALVKKEQLGFQRAVGTQEFLFLLKQAVTTSLTRHGSCHVVSLDIAKAFDSVPHARLLRAMGAKGIPRNSAHLLFNLITGHTASSADDTLTIPLHRGVLQGGILSPLLFNAFIDELIPLPPVMVLIILLNLNIKS